MPGKINGHPFNLVVLVVIVAFWTFIASSCASLGKNSKEELATKALLATKNAVVGLAEAADTACTYGLLKQEACDMAKEYYEKAQVSYNVAADSLVIALQTNDAGFWQAYQANRERLFQIYADLEALAIEFGILKGGQ